MAAVLCASINTLLRGCCEAVGTVLTLPCKACGFATGQLTDICRSPFCLYLTVALGLNLPPIILTGTAWGGRSGEDGCTSAFNWLVLNALLCLINMAGAVYISMKIAHEPEDDNAAPFVEASVYNKESDTKAPEKTITQRVMESTLETDSKAKSFARVKEVICYDPIVAVYIIVKIVFFVWQTIGVGRNRLAMDCGGGLDESLSHSLMCGFLYIFLGSTAFAMSICCLGAR